MFRVYNLRALSFSIRSSSHFHFIMGRHEPSHFDKLHAFLWGWYLLPRTYSDKEEWQFLILLFFFIYKGFCIIYVYVHEKYQFMVYCVN